MTHYSVQTSDISGFLSFAKNMGRGIGKNVSKNLGGKCSQKLIDHAK